MQANEPKSDGTSKSVANRLTSFFTSLTGVITSLVALLGAAGTLYIAVVGRDGDNNPEREKVGNVTVPIATVPAATVPATTPATSSIADWRREANQICADFHREVRTTLGRAPQTVQEFAYYLQQVTPMATRASVALAGLDRPPDRATEITEMVDAFNERDASAAEAVMAWNAGNAPAYQRAVADVNRLDVKGSRIAAALGASECAVNPFA
jgi:hypothetical protein